MTSMNEFLLGQLKKLNIDYEAFQSLLQRLLDYGVLCRDESQTEMEFYDLYLRCKSLIDDFLLVLDIRIDHQPHFQFLRLFPPGADVPGMDDAQSPFSGFRSRLNQHEVALILVLRHQYEQLLHEGNIDELGCAALSIESLNIAMKSLLNRSMPVNVTERKALLVKMRQLRLIKLTLDNDGNEDDSWLKVRPMITSMVTTSVLETLNHNSMPATDNVLTSTDTIKNDALHEQPESQLDNTQ
ncbi:MAG: DUF4194 domain-containing protein [Pseudomonadota bacterium]